MDAMRARWMRSVTARSAAIVVTLVGLALPTAWIVLSRTDRSTGDVAYIELQIRDVLSRHPPVVGAYSRYGWSHPGPLMFYVFALPYRLLGNDSDALRMTVLLFNMVVITIIGWLVVRRGTAMTIAVSAVLFALVWGALPHLLSEGWNVSVATMPFVLTIVACWCALCGDRWALLVAGLAFSFVFQAHIGFGLVVAPLMLVTLATVAARRWRSTPTSGGKGTMHVAFGVGLCAVLFIPVIADVALHWPGNISHLVKWSLTNDEPQVGLSNGLRVIGRASSLSFLSHPQVPNQFVLTIDSIAAGFMPGTLLLLLVIALVVSVRRGLRAEKLLCVCLLLVWCGGALAATKITEPLYPWLIDWLQPLAWLTWSAVAVVAWRVAQAALDRGASWARIRATVLALALVSLVAGTVIDARHTATADYLSVTAQPVVDRFADAAAALGKDRPLTIVYEGESLTAGTLMAGVVNRLDQWGFDMCVDAGLGYQYGSQRVCIGRPGEYLMIRGEQTVVPPPDGATVLAISDPLSESERAEADGITERLAAILVAYERDDQIHLLYSPFAGLILNSDAPDELIRERASIERLSELRQVPGYRFGLYRVFA